MGDPEKCGGHSSENARWLVAKVYWNLKDLGPAAKRYLREVTNILIWPSVIQAGSSKGLVR
jgi:hypothetical protein